MRRIEKRIRSLRAENGVETQDKIRRKGYEGIPALLRAVLRQGLSRGASGGFFFTRKMS
ncbi:hypothetical protein TRIP_E370089 [uncultured Spirochaetota bacterium]|uniref:Uncharacterized protein n=1 Tax=uncultured Spirochaetota bacterium TaxID=460511 RepID=A0A652ZYL0_9SPIR|nr:hypothetical protein TRIP_E370089 [uncultured Spirochaetota bacterium]